MDSDKTQPLSDFECQIARGVLTDTATALRDDLPMTYQMRALALIAARGIAELMVQTSLFETANQDALDLLIGAQLAEMFPKEADDDQR